MLETADSVASMPPPMAPENVIVTARKRHSISKEVPSPPKTDAHHKPQRREIGFSKSPGASFGACLCRINRGVYITFIVRGSIAWSLGLQAGDRIDAIDDIFVYEGNVSASEVLVLLRTGSTMRITVCELPLATAYVLRKNYGMADLGLVYHNRQIVDFNPKSAMAAAGVSRGESVVAVDDFTTLGKTDQEIRMIIESNLNSRGRVALLCMPPRFVAELGVQWDRYHPIYHTSTFCTDEVVMRVGGDYESLSDMRVLNRLAGTGISSE